MTQTITIDGVSRGGAIPRESITWSQSAYLGEVAEGAFMLRDTAGSISIVGHKTIEVDQSASSPARIATQFVGPKSIKTRAAPFGAGREIEVTTRDLNALLTRDVFHGSGAAGGNRPAETIAARLAFIIGTWLEPRGVYDFGRVTYPSHDIDKKELRGSKPGDELSAMAKVVRFNYYVRYNEGEGAYELVFRDDNASTDDSATVRISNAVGEADASTVFAPLTEATDFAEDPDEVYSGAYAAYGRGSLYRTRAATAAAFVERDGVTEDSGTRTAAHASRDANTFLYESRSEEQAIDLTLRLRAAQLGLFLPGMRVQTKMVHLAPEGWAAGSGRWARIARQRISQPLKTDFDYDVALHLLPQEDAPASACGYDATPGGSFYPLGQGPEGDSHSNPSDGVVQYARAGVYYAVTPMPGAESIWHFPQYGAGGAGTIDYAGDCTGNQLRFVLVGPGTLTVQTEIHASGVRPMAGSWGPSPGGFENSIGAFSSGTEVEFDITGDCANVVILGDGPGSPCGGKWGWSVATWVPA